jgi:hypothetical protein
VSRDVTFRAWRPGQLDEGTHLGTEATAAGLRPAQPVGTRRYVDPYGVDTARDYGWSAWLSPAVTPGHRFTSLIPSWNARTPGDSWLEVEARVSSDRVHWSRWYVLARWAETESEIHRTSVRGQGDDVAQVNTDVLAARAEVSWTSYQLRVTFHGKHHGTEPASPVLSLIGAVAAGPLDPASQPRTDSGRARGTELPVPAYSQQLHRGEYPHLDSGGESWCSPTSTTMVLGRWGLGPTEEEYDWVDPSYRDRFVDHAARSVFDHAYRGAGNWTFNTAYAARYGAEAFVTRLRSVDEAARFIEAGIPLVVTVSFRDHPLDGAGYETTGHLLTIIGFDETGNVISNDPASHKVPSNDEVRTVYDRGQFERVWLESGGGVAYVVRPPEVPLPPYSDPAQPNW